MGLAYQLPDDQREAPIGVVDQTIWHFTKAGNGFLFGYVWRSLNNEFPQNVVHWSFMVRETRLDKILPGTAFTINDIQKSFPLSSLPPSVPEVEGAPPGAVAMQPAPTPPLVCVQAGSVSMPPSDSWYVVPNATLLAYQLPDDHRNGPIGVVDQTIWHFTKVENGFLFGYVWRSLNNEFPENVARILATLTHTGDVEFYFYESSKIVNFAKGKYDSLSDTFYDMQTSGGGSSVVHWSWMVRETDLDKLLPGTTFSIDDILSSEARGCSFCGSSLPPTTPSF